MTDNELTKMREIIRTGEKLKRSINSINNTLENLNDKTAKILEIKFSYISADLTRIQDINASSLGLTDEYFHKIYFEAISNVLHQAQSKCNTDFINLKIE